MRWLNVKAQYGQILNLARNGNWDAANRLADSLEASSRAHPNWDEIPADETMDRIWGDLIAEEEWTENPRIDF